MKTTLPSKCSIAACFFCGPGFCSTSPEVSSLIANHRGDAQSRHTEKRVLGSLTGAEFDVGDLRICRFREFVDGPVHRCRREVETN